MTLCIAAGCDDWRTGVEKARIVFCADHRIETDIASSDIALKFDTLTDHFWMMFAGDISKARAFGDTLQTALANAVFDPDDIEDRLNEAAAIHKRKLCETLVSLRLGMTWERFLTKGESEITSEVRNRTWYDIQELDFDCELLVFGFARRVTSEAASVFRPYIFSSNRCGEFRNDGDFSAIGSGSTMAEGNLFFREQRELLSVEHTLYNVFESARLVYDAKAPGVGETQFFLVAEPKENGLRLKVINNEKGKLVLEKWRTKYGPKPITKLGKLTAGHFTDMPEFSYRERESPEKDL